MYIPLDHLYHWIHSVASRPAIIYYLYPYGSKNLSQCTWYPANQCLEKHREDSAKIPVFCHDQEPLNFDFYQNVSLDDILIDHGHQPGTPDYKNFDRTLKNLDMIISFWNSHIYDHNVLIHSELNSYDVDQYQQAGYQTVHYWCHGLVARDWYRFASIDQRLNHCDVPALDFLIYARDWSGSREYRLKFLEIINAKDLYKQSLVYFKAVSSSSNSHYHNHVFENQKFNLITKDLDDKFLTSMVGPEASADYCVDDHVNAKISVVLETLFDDSKIHLTEKICRALACAHPFILAAGPGSLEYLRSYGFETFEPWLDESYDKETDSLTRLQKISLTMSKFCSLDTGYKQMAYQQLKSIAKRNQQRFFSNDLGVQLTAELQKNLDTALHNASYTKGDKYRRRLKVSTQIKGRKYSHTPAVLNNLKLIKQLRRQKSSF